MCVRARFHFFPAVEPCHQSAGQLGGPRLLWGCGGGRRIGLLAAVAIPNFGHAMATAQRRACASNRKNIDGAKLQGATENQQPRTAVPTDQDLFGEDAYIEVKPYCPVHGIYSLNAVNAKCTCSVEEHAN